jgi:3,4-dehydroadipyl-CoA semialdehyde dehydrogenase
MKLESFVGGSWVAGSEDGRPFVNPVTDAILGTVDDTGIDPAATLDYARRKGCPALAASTFADRGDILRAIADVLTANRPKYFEIARLNSGNTPADAAIDIDGAIGTLRVYARYGKSLGAAKTIIEPGQDQLTKEPIFFARHIWTTRPGVALQINAFNFPSWGLWEKVAAALLSGVPSVAKPASTTAWLSHEMVRDIVAANVVPLGTLSLVCGSGKGLCEALQPMDSLAFTGSANTALALRSGPSILRNAPRISIEADSINATIVGPDGRPGSAVFDLAVAEVTKALTVKAGQLCTNIRRIFVQNDQFQAFGDAVAAELKTVVVGDPAIDGVRMGPLVNTAQQAAALEGINRLRQEAVVVAGGGRPGEVQGVEASRGSFIAPTLLACSRPSEAKAVHDTEVFGPCATVMPYHSIDEAVSLGARSAGSLALSLFSADTKFHKAVLIGLAPWHGRVLSVNEEVGKKHTGHAIVMPQCVHGGPGRAGGGEELGGLRALRSHMQRSAAQGSASILAELSGDAVEASL